MYCLLTTKNSMPEQTVRMTPIPGTDEFKFSKGEMPYYLHILQVYFVITIKKTSV